MANEIITQRDALRHTAGRSAASVGLTVLLTLSLCLLQFGSDPDALVRAGFVTKSSIMISITISGLLTAGLSYTVVPSTVTWGLSAITGETNASSCEVVA